MHLSLPHDVRLALFWMDRYPREPIKRHDDRWRELAHDLAELDMELDNLARAW